MEREFNTTAKGIDEDQHAQSAQSDLGLNLLLMASFPHVKQSVYPRVHPTSTQNEFYDSILNLSKRSLILKCLQGKSFENTVGKGRIARNEQFLLFPHCFLPFRMSFCVFRLLQNYRLQTRF